MTPLARIRALAMALPEVTERVSHGSPSWFVRRAPQFVMFADRHHDDRVAFWAAAPDGAQSDWVARAADRYFVPPYVGTRGWIGVYLDTEVGQTGVEWAEIEDIIEDAYRSVAPRKLLLLLDEQSE